MIVSISGPSASGKTSVARAILNYFPEGKMLESVTTRPPRPSDVPGEYRYVTEEAFEALKRSGQFLWDVAVHGNRYGMTKDAVERALDEKLIVAILVIPAAKLLAEYVAKLKASDKFFPVYLRIADEAVLRDRLTRRGDREADIALRIRECKNWDAEAASSGVPFTTLDSGLPIEILMQGACEAVAGALRK